LYRQQHFREDRPEVLHALIRRHPLGTLITNEGGLDANHLPFILTAGADGRDRLQAHLPRTHDGIPALRAGGEVLLVFRGAESYITPSWYPSKHEHGRAVPTWNYVVVQAWGRPAIIDDRDWVMAQIAALTAQHEGDRAEPWSIFDALADYTEKMVAALVGVDVVIDRIEGKWKVSQNRSEADRQGVVEGLRCEMPSSPMADLVAERGAAG
jgi:transcriptional regulator